MKDKLYFTSNPHFMKFFITLMLSSILLTSCTQTMVTSNTELLIEDTVIGTGEEAKIGDTVEVHYTGTLEDGSKFDSSKDRGQSFSFTIGEGRVIEGWEKGVPGMKIGGTRMLNIPSDMAYGENGIPGAIPGGATLIFEVELISISND